MIIAAIGLASALYYLWRRRWTDAALVLVAALALAALVEQLARPADQLTTLDIGDGQTPAAVGAASALTLSGDGLRAAQWRDLPARPLRWTSPATDALWLDFPRQIALGRSFTLSARRAQVQGAWRLQLLAENGALLAEKSGTGASLQVDWLPAVAETLTLRARLLDGAGKVIDQGPVPLVVSAAVPLQVVGRFDAPSFDVQALNRLLIDSNAILDWQVRLGKTVTRAETPRTALEQANLIVADAAFIEQLGASERAALLARVGAGVPLLVPMINDRRHKVKRQVGAAMALPLASLAPTPGRLWRSGDQPAWWWQRPWQRGRIVWLGVVDWHRYAISAPQALTQWWQQVLDVAGVQRAEPALWLPQIGMPLPGERAEACVRGTTKGAQARADMADAACSAFWPERSGWTMATVGQASAPLYVYAPADWPLWQRAQRRDATARYAARSPGVADATRQRLPAWPLALLCCAALFGLWWRERR